MNETIGVKGGHQDRRRSLKISKKVVEKLKEQTEQEKIKELEEITRKKQILNFIKIIPMIFLGQLLSKKESPKHEKIEIIPIDKEEIKLTPINTKNKPIIPPPSPPSPLKLSIFMIDKKKAFILSL